MGGRSGGGGRSARAGAGAGAGASTAPSASPASPSVDRNDPLYFRDPQTGEEFIASSGGFNTTSTQYRNGISARVNGTTLIMQKGSSREDFDLTSVTRGGSRDEFLNPINQSLRAGNNDAINSRIRTYNSRIRENTREINRLESTAPTSGTTRLGTIGERFGPTRREVVAYERGLRELNQTRKAELQQVANWLEANRRT